MQYVRSISGSVSKTWNSINPATLSGAIDVIVVEHEDGTLACSPFHVRFGKFSLLRPHEKKVEFKVNDVKRDFPMKLGEGGEAFFVFETTTAVPEAMQTSPLASPVTSPEMRPSSPTAPSLSEADPDPLELSDSPPEQLRSDAGPMSESIPIPGAPQRSHSESGSVTTSLTSFNENYGSTPSDQASSLQRFKTDHSLPADRMSFTPSLEAHTSLSTPTERPASPVTVGTARSSSPPNMSSEEARTRAINLSKKLWTSNIPSHVTDQGDLMLDMTGYKASDEEALRAEVIARKILSEELEGNYDIGSLIGADENGNLWIYSSEEAKEQASRKLTASMHDLSRMTLAPSTDAISDPGYHSDDARSELSVELAKTIQRSRHDSDSAVGMSSPPFSNVDSSEPSKSYAKTLRLTSDQLKDLQLKPGQNSLAFTVNRATCTASLFLWRYDVPIVISDIDGTITKSDALGHVLNMIGRDWTHLGVAKLYTEIFANGYNLLYLTSRSVGQADTTRAYLNGVVQEGYKLPKGPVLLSPDRTMAALRREVYLRKPEVFKMACLRDIMDLFQGAGGSRAMFVDPGSPTTETGGQIPLPGDAPAPAKGGGSPFYAGFGNRLTDAISYRSVKIPSTRIFTINTSSEVSLDLVSLSNYRTGYSSMREIVDHFFPPVDLLVKGGGEEFTDFNYWRDRPLEIEDFSASESEYDDDDEDEEDLDDDEMDEEEEDEDFDDAEDERSFVTSGRTPAFTPGVMSEDEYNMSESFFSSGGRPSLEHSMIGSLHSARDVLDKEGESGGPATQPEGSVVSDGAGSKKAIRRRRVKNSVHSVAFSVEHDADDDDGDDEAANDADDDVTTTLTLDELSPQQEQEIEALARTLGEPPEDDPDDRE